MVLCDECLAGFGSLRGEEGERGEREKGRKWTSGEDRKGNIYVEEGVLDNLDGDGGPDEGCLQG